MDVVTSNADTFSDVTFFFPREKKFPRNFSYSFSCFLSLDAAVATFDGWLCLFFFFVVFFLSFRKNRTLKLCLGLIKEWDIFLMWFLWDGWYRELFLVSRGFCSATTSYTPTTCGKQDCFSRFSLTRWKGSCFLKFSELYLWHLKLLFVWRTDTVKIKNNK